MGKGKGKGTREKERFAYTHPLACRTFRSLVCVNHGPAEPDETAGGARGRDLTAFFALPVRVQICREPGTGGPFRRLRWYVEPITGCLG